jgi:hypothetical protein
MCPKFIFVFPIRITFLNPIYRILYIAMPTRYVLFCPMCLFQFDSFLHPMCHRLYIFILSRMCSFIVCFILSCSFATLSPFRCVIYLMMSFPPECVPLSYVSYFFIVFWIAFLHYIWHQLSIVRYTRDMFFYPVWTVLFCFFDSDMIWWYIMTHRMKITIRINSLK